MTRKDKRSKTPVTWYGGCFSNKSTGERLFLWGTLTKEVASVVLPMDAPDAALIALYQEARAKTVEPPEIVHFIDERLQALGKALAGVTIKGGKREAFLPLLAAAAKRSFPEPSKTLVSGFGSYLLGEGQC